MLIDKKLSNVNKLTFEISVEKNTGNKHVNKYIYAYIGTHYSVMAIEN